MLKRRRQGVPATRHLIVALLVLALGSAACAPDSASPSPPSASAPAAASLDVDEVIDLLAAAGIGVFEDVLAPTPVKSVADPASPLAVIRWQVENLTGEAVAGAGMLGFRIDELGADLGLGASDLPASYLLAGWIADGATEAARQAAVVMGERDWTHPEAIIVPHLVLLLFFSDLATEMVKAVGPTAESEPAAAARHELADDPLVGQLAVAGPVAGPTLAPPAATCFDLEKWIADTLASVFHAFQLAEGDGVFGFLGKVWNAGLDLAREALTKAISQFGRPLFTIVKSIAVAIGVITYFVSFLSPWTVKVTSAGPAGNHFAHPGEPDPEFQVTATVSTTEQTWEAALLDCARAADVPLPNTDVAGKRIEWYEEHLADKPLADRIGASATMSSSNTASATYEARRESPFDVQGDDFDGQLRVVARVIRIEPLDQEKLLNKLFVSGDAGDALKAVLGSVLGDVAKALGAKASAEGYLNIEIDYHEVGGVCLDGVWELDLGSARALIDQLTGDALNVTGLSGSVIRAYQRNGTFIERHAGFLIEVRSLIGTPEAPLHTIDTSVITNGYSTGKYEIESLIAATSTVTYSALDAGNYLVVGRTSIDNTVSSASEIEFPLFEASEGERETTCAGDTFIETWAGDQYLLRWNRIGVADPEEPDGEPVETPRTFGNTASVTVKVGSAEYELTGGSCLYLPMGEERHFNLNVNQQLGEPGETPDPNDPNSPIANQFSFSFPVRFDGEYEFGENPPTGIMDGAAFQLLPSGMVTFEQNVTEGVFSGENIEIFGGEDISGSFSCF